MSGRSFEYGRGATSAQDDGFVATAGLVAGNRGGGCVAEAAAVAAAEADSDGGVNRGQRVGVLAGVGIR